MIQNTYFQFLKTSCKQLASTSTRALGSGKEILSKYDKSQTETFDEPLILVDENDKPVGKVGKYEAHVNELNKNQPAHRAFSVFMFDEKNRLLLHKRSAKKITFPNYWTNTCCSHPLNIESEKEENENIGNALILIFFANCRSFSLTGIKKAAQRRLKFELGYDLEKPEDLNFVGKILYEAPYDQYWGEKESNCSFFVGLRLIMHITSGLYSIAQSAF